MLTRMDGGSNDLKGHQQGLVLQFRGGDGLEAAMQGLQPVQQQLGSVGGSGDGVEDVEGFGLLLRRDGEATPQGGEFGVTAAGQLLLQAQHPLERAAVATQAHLILQAAALVRIQQGGILHTQLVEQQAMFT